MITGSSIGSHIQSVTEDKRQMLKQMVRARLLIDDHARFLVRLGLMR